MGQQQQKQQIEDECSDVQGDKVEPFVVNQSRDEICELKPINPIWLQEAYIPVISMPACERECVECPIIAQYFDNNSNNNINMLKNLKFGRESREQLFQIEEGWNFINHGSYGATFRLATQTQQWYLEFMERQPQKFIEIDVHPLVHKAVEEVAELVSADVADIVPLINTTMAVNLVAKSVRLEKGDLILMTSETYGSIKNTLIQVAKDRGAGILTVNFNLDILSDENKIMNAFSTALEAHGNSIKFALIDHIPSFPPVILPIKKICAMFRSRGIRVMVDGAHVIGQIPLNIPDIGADFYATNLHKWLCTPKGTAILWVGQQAQSKVAPLITSHGYGGNFVEQMWWIGTQDWSGWCAVPVSIKIFKMLGLRKTQQYNRKLVREASKMLSAAFNTDNNIGRTKQVVEWGNMIAVELPPIDSTRLRDLSLTLRNKYKIEVPIQEREGKRFVRISCQIYNEMKEYEALRDAILELS